MFQGLKIQQANYKIIIQNDFNISPDLFNVKVFNERNANAKQRSEIEPVTHRVVKRKSSIFVIEDENNNKFNKSRYQIDVQTY